MTSGPLANSTAHWRALDAAHHLHPFSNTKALNAEGVRVITRAEGSWIFDSEGNRILDGMSGLWCTQVGHGRAEIVDAIAAQLRELDFYNTFFKTTHPGAAELSAAIAAVAPEGMSRVFFTSGGSEAVDTVLRMVRHYWAAMDRPQKSIFISRRNAYHGSTMAGASLGGMAPMHAQGGLPIPGIVHVRQPYWWAEGYDLSPDEFGLVAAGAVAEAIDAAGPENVAAFIGEPIQGAGGVIIPPPGYWTRVEAICRKYGILLVADEVICGFGRLGRWFGFQHFGFRPDIVTMAKGLSSGYLPISATGVSGAIVDVLKSRGGEFIHGYTYSGHPTAAAVALKNLEIIAREKLVERVAEDVGPYFARALGRLKDHPLVGEARSVGLIGAIEIVSKKGTNQRFGGKEGTAGPMVRDLCINNGLMVRAIRDSIVMCPPLVISHAEIDRMIDIIERSLKQAEAPLRAVKDAA